MTQTGSVTTPLPGNPPAGSPQPPSLENGDHLTRDDFERRYHARPDLKKVELIEGVVHMPSPVRMNQHGRPFVELSWWLTGYRAFTPGVQIGGDVTVRMDLDNEPQPDVVLFIEPAHGGKQVRLGADDYLEGAPELVAEVASSTVSIALNTKLRVYRRNGVREYIVWRVQDQALDWFVLRQGQYDRLTPSSTGVLKSEAFPGLWLDVGALLRGDLPAVLRVLQQGLASPEHAAFVARLQSAAAGQPGSGGQP